MMLEKIRLIPMVEVLPGTVVVSATVVDSAAVDVTTIETGLDFLCVNTK
jgi:hypothetical protein